MRKILILFFSFIVLSINIPLVSADSFSDSFTNTNGVTLPEHNSLWQCFINSSSIFANHAKSDNNESYCFSNNTWSNGYAQITTFFPLGSTDTRIRVVVRNNTYPNDYICEATPSGINILKGSQYLASNPNVKMSSGIHTLKCQTENTSLKAYFDGTQVLQVNDSSISTGNAGFQLLNDGLGSYYDDWISLDSDLNSSTSLLVPYFNQNDLPWGPTEYDSTKSLGALSETMDRWGCAVTSAAMVLNYHNITQFQNGTPIDPGSLNTWLKNNKGYLTGGKGNNWYSSIDWTKIASLTKKLNAVGKAPYSLEYSPIQSNPTQQTKTILDNDLTVGNTFGPFPDILWVKNNQTDSHFVVAKGSIDDIYLINDPEWNYQNLSYFNNSYMQIGRYIPSNTDLSYLVIVVNSNVEMLITDPLGRKTGKYLANDSIETYNEIPNAMYNFEPPLSNPNTNDITEKLGTGVNSFLLPKPIIGDYTIILSSKDATIYTINLSTMEKNGDNELTKFEGIVSLDNNDITQINYANEGKSVTKKTVTFTSTLEDIKELREQGLLNFSTSLVMIAVVKNAEQLYVKEKSQQTKKILDVVITLIEKSPKGFIDPVANEIILYDLNQLNLLLN